MNKLDANCPPIDVVLSRVRYEPETGKFRAIKSAGKRKAGAECGYADRLGYIKLCFNGKWVLAHRLAWRIHHGEWPRDEVDHINGNPSDNRIDNLRCGSRRQNMRNVKRGKGWHWHSTRKKWQALIRLEGKRKYLGSFDTEQEAKDCYLVAAEKYFGEWSFHNRPAPSAPVQGGLDLG